jgi:hypothetical protein
VFSYTVFDYTIKLIKKIVSGKASFKEKLSQTVSAFNSDWYQVALSSFDQNIREYISEMKSLEERYGK